MLAKEQELNVTNKMISSPQATQLRTKRELLFAKKGLAYGLLAGLTWAIASVFLLGHALGTHEFQRPELWLFAPILGAGIHDTAAAIAGFILNCVRGQGKELRRTLKSKPGKYCIAGGILGAPFGMGGYLLAISMAGAAYVLPITSLYPAFAAVLATIFLKEQINKRAWIGLFSCIIGAFIISYVPPSGGQTEYFYIGLLLAVIASVGWASEGVLVTSAMDFVEPGIALNIYQITSSLLYIFIIIPMVFFFTVPAEFINIQTILDLFTSTGIIFVICAGIVGSLSYNCWYKAMNTTGVSRAMAINITYALWGVILSAVFLDVEITINLMIGALVIFSGMVLVIGNPKDLVNLRKTS